MAPEPIDISNFTDQLHKNPEGIWTVKRVQEVSFPKTGHLDCHAMEDKSFWFKNRNFLIHQTISNFPPQGPIFEVGAGNGFVSKYLSDQGLQVVAIEPGPDGARAAHQRGLVVCHSDFDSCGFDANSLPAIAAFDVIEHIKDDQDFIHKASKALGPNGIFYATVPSFGFLWSETDDYTGHFRRYTKKTFKDLLNPYFEIQYISYFFWYLVGPIYLFRHLPYVMGFKVHEKRKALIEHGVKGPKFFSFILKNLFKIDLALVKKNKQIPFGSSLIVVAKPRKGTVG